MAKLKNVDHASVAANVSLLLLPSRTDVDLDAPIKTSNPSRFPGP